MRRTEVVVNVFVFIECYELSPGRLLLRNDTPIFTEHPEKQRPRVHFQRGNLYTRTFLLGVISVMHR